MSQIIKGTEEEGFRARSDRRYTNGLVIGIDTTLHTCTVDVGAVDANGNPVYLRNVPFQPQTPPTSGDRINLIYSNVSPHSVMVAGGQLSGQNAQGSLQVIGAVTSLKKTGETTGQQGDLELEATGNLTLTRTNKKFSFSETNQATLGGLEDTGVTLVQNGSIFTYYYNTGVNANRTFVLPNLILASGAGQMLEYTFVNFSDYNVGVYANTVAFTNYIEESLPSLGIGPGQYFTFSGIQGVGSDGKWRITNFNQRLLLSNLQTGTSYTLTLGDLGKVVMVNNASPVTVTVPTNASVKFPIGALVTLNQVGAGLLTLAAAGGVTLHNSGGLTAIKQYASMLLRKIDTDEWIVTNDVFGVSGGSQVVQSISIVISGGGSVLAVGQYVDVVFEYACTINQNTLVADQSGSVVLDLRKATYANFDDSTHPGSGDSICASAKPTISSAVKSQDTSLTGWTTAINAGDIVRVYVVSVATITQVTLSLKVTRT